jgi:predicted ATPase/DNA-binding SARP family transcriptional activator
MVPGFGPTIVLTALGALMRVDIHLLGGFEVLVDREHRPDEAWSRRAAASLVKLLALAPGHRLPRERVIDALWPDVPLDRAAPRLHKAAHHARSALGVADGLVLADDMVLLLPHAELRVDVEHFEALAEAARGDGAQGLAEEAVDAYRGDLLPGDLYEPWTQDARDRLRLRYVGLLNVLGRWDAVVASDPLDEEAWLRLVHSHLERRDRGAALRQLEAMESAWRRELDEGLGEEALALREAALRLPVRVRSTQRAPVPLPPTPTVGRGRDIEGVVRALQEARILTLLGPGGVGKTRLAIEAALTWTETTSEECCFVDLTKVGEHELVPDLVARELGIQLEARGDAELALQETLQGETLVLVLDNFEHVLDAADLVGRLVQRSPTLRVLTTSRARLRLAGERVFDVSPLALGAEDDAVADDSRPDALALFEQVASAVDPHFDLGTHIGDVAAICRAVDGLPLAIELAAVHTRTLPPPLLRSRLGARLASSAAATRDVAPRQQTIVSAIDWSLQLLEPADRSLFARLGVFAGPVPLEAIEAVCGTNDKVAHPVDSLARLVDHSLVRRVLGELGDARFGLLELLRERARELLVADQEAYLDAQRRHTDYVVGFLDDLEESRWSVDAGRWIQPITGLFPDIRAVQSRAAAQQDAQVLARIAADLGTYWHREGHHAEGRAWAAAALAHEEDLDAELCARLHLSAGLVSWTRDEVAARRHFTEALETFGATGHRRYLSYAMMLSAITHVGDPASHEIAMGLCQHSIDLAREVDEGPLLAQALNIQGELARVAGDDDLALAAYEEGLAVARAAGDLVHASMLVGNMSFIADHRGDYHGALRLAREALQLAWSLGRRLEAAMMVLEMAGPELGLGRPERSAIFLGAGEDAMRRLGVGLHPGDRPEYERMVTGLRAAIGDAELSRLTREGAQLSFEEAVVLALSEDSPMRRTPP